MATLSDNEKLHLKKMIDKSDCENNTDYIRKVKHSVLIRDDFRTLDTLKKTELELRNNSPEEFIALCQSKCPFIYNNYTDLFNRHVKDEIDLTIMTKLLTVLKLIEDGKTDQHEASVMVGKILKELYIDSAIKRADNLDKIHEEEKPKTIEGSSISWKEYKKGGTNGSPLNPLL
jgi:hypothetical protein